jgi:hypothetical protein
MDTWNAEKQSRHCKQSARSGCAQASQLQIDKAPDIKDLRRLYEEML